MRFVPLFFGELVETLVSMRRIQRFLMCDEINPAIISNITVR